MRSYVGGYKTETNEKGIRALVEKATHRAEWYKKEYWGCKDFHKRLLAQYATVVKKFTSTHEITDEQMQLLRELTPEKYKAAVQ